MCGRTPLSSCCTCFGCPRAPAVAPRPRRYQHAELRISVYGRKPVEWDILATWVVANNLVSNNVVWLIQIPRLYNVYRDQVWC